jgi:hypothetical protein
MRKDVELMAKSPRSRIMHYQVSKTASSSRSQVWSEKIATRKAGPAGAAKQSVKSRPVPDGGSQASRIPGRHRELEKEDEEDCLITGVVMSRKRREASEDELHPQRIFRLAMGATMD